MAAENITVNIIDGVANIQQKGFGIPAVFGESEQFNVLVAGTGKSQLIGRSESRGEAVTWEIVAGSGLEWTDTGSKVTLTLDTAGNTAKEAFDDYTDNAPSTVKDLIIITLANSGSAAVALLTETALASQTEFVITKSEDVNALLLPFYLSTDREVVMAAALFNQDLKPEKAYVFNGGSGSAAPPLTTILPTFTNQDYYFLLLTDVTKTRAIEAGAFGEANEKLVVVLNTDSTVLDDLSLVTSTAGFISTNVTTQSMESALVGLQAPKNPGSTSWNWKQVNGIAAETGLTLISDVQTKNGNTFIEEAGIIHSLGGKMTNGLFIDQKRSRDFVKARIEEAFIALLATEEKIPYTNQGIDQVVGTLSDRLNSFGDDGIIATADSTEEQEKSFNGVYQYSIAAPTRAEVLDSDPTDITGREYVFTFEYVEAGAIEELTITGKIVLELQ